MRSALSKSAGLALVLALLAGPVAAQTLPGIPKIEIPAPADGLPDPLDPGYFAPLDLAPPADPDRPHPRLLFSASDLPAIRERIADADSVPGRAFRTLLEGAERLQVGSPVTHRDFGRQDLANLALAWLLTEDRSYLDKAKELLVVVAAAAPNYGGYEVFDLTEYYNTRAHILNGLALAWDWLYADLDEVERNLLLSALVVLGSEHFLHSLTAWWGTVSSGSNFTGNNGAAVGMAGLATWGHLPQAPLWFARGHQLVRSYFEEGFDPQGAGIEGVLYGNYGLRIPTYFGAAAELAGAPHPLYHAIRRQPRWVAYEVLPGGGAVNPLNDARYYELNPTHMLWASSNGMDPDLAGWIWRNVTAKIIGDDGNIPEHVAAMLWWREPDPGFSPADILPLSQAYRKRGLVHARSGWGPDDLMSSFESRHNDWGEGVHQNSDINSFTLYSHGARMVVDSGYSNYLSKVLLDQDFEAARSSQSEAHNYITASGRSQDFFGKGRLVSVVSADWLDVAHGDARPAYMTLQPEAADRHWIHVRSPDGGPAYIVLADHFRQGLGPHRYDFYLHTEPGNTIDLGAGPPVATFRAPNGASLSVSMLAASPIRVRQDTFTADYPDIGTHPRLVVTSNTTDFRALTTLVPAGAGHTAAAGQQVEARGGLAMVQGDDLLLLRTSRGTAMTSGLRSDGVLAFYRDEGRFAMVEGNRLGGRQRLLARVDGHAATVVAGGGEVAIDGERVDGFRVWAPGAHLVRVNGEGVPFSSCGGYVVGGREC